MSQIANVSAVAGLIALALVLSDITLGAEPIQTFLHTAFDTGLPVLMTVLASLMLACMVARHPFLRRVPSL